MCGSGLAPVGGHISPPLQLTLLIVGNCLRKVPVSVRAVALPALPPVSQS